MDRCAVFIDAGYLFAAGGELGCNTRARIGLQLDSAGFTSMIAEFAAGRCSLPVLRTYWYDGAREGIATPPQQTIAALPNVKLRLGRLNARNEQKGVDALIYRDLMTLARERAIADAVLLSGDDDLREGVRSAQDMGVRVTLVGIPPVGQEFNQARALVDEADEVLVLSKADLLPFFRHVAPELPTPSTTISVGTTDLARVTSVGKEFAESWWHSASDTDRQALEAQRPKIPQTLDIELIKHAELIVKRSLRGHDDAHRALRKGFWTGVGGARDASASS